jgi:hypothetical protein
MYEYNARLMVRSNGRHPIYDGDTMWLEVDLGFGLTFALGPCRLFGIDTIKRLCCAALPTGHYHLMQFLLHHDMQFFFHHYLQRDHRPALLSKRQIYL